MAEKFAAMLSGGHPNSLGRTDEVVELVIAQPARFKELFHCYQSDDAVVRLRTSSAMKRVEAANHALLIPWIDRFIDEIGALDQASAQWTLAQLFVRLEDEKWLKPHLKRLASDRRKSVASRAAKKLQLLG